MGILGSLWLLLLWFVLVLDMMKIYQLKLIFGIDLTNTDECDLSHITLMLIFRPFVTQIDSETTVSGILQMTDVNINRC